MPPLFAWSCNNLRYIAGHFLNFLFYFLFLFFCRVCVEVVDIVLFFWIGFCLVDIIELE